MTRATDLAGVGLVDTCHLVGLREHRDFRGGLTVIETGIDVAFPIERVYYIYDVPTDEIRGAHGHRALRQLIIAAHGRFDITVDDGFRQERFTLDRPDLGLYIGPMIWRELVNFSAGAVGLVLASSHYDPSDYYHEYVDFRNDARAVIAP